MMGASGFAHEIWCTAVQNPPHLKCIVPAPGLTDNYRGFYYPGGVLQREIVFLLVDAMNLGQWPGPVPGKELPENLVLDYLTNFEDGPLHLERSVWHRMGDIKVPVLNIVPGNNHHSPTHLRSYVDITAPKKLRIVPYTYAMYMKYVFECLPLQQYVLRWFDYWLKGIETGIMGEPEVAVYDNGTGRWRYENEYPMARTEWQKWYLHEKTEATASRGSISETQPAAEEQPDTFNHPSGRFNPVQYLGYETPPLEEDLPVSGPVSITFYASTTSGDTSDWAFFVKLGDIAPSGEPPKLMERSLYTDMWTPPEVFLWSNGNLKTKFREVDESMSRPGLPWHPFKNPTDCKPNTVYEFQVELWPVFNTFKKGHKIWVQIACQSMSHDSQDFTTTQSITPHIALRGAYNSEISVYHSAEYPSHLLLPVIPPAPEIAPVRAPLKDVVPGAPHIYT
jgi:predicted acyl esterase